METRNRRHVPVLLGLSAVVLSSSALAQTALVSIPGQPGDRMGSAMVDAGDVDGDGWSDYLVGKPFKLGGRGAVACLSGAFLANQSSVSTIYEYVPGFVSGDAAFGTSIAPMGDVTGDGVIDFAIGAPFHDTSPIFPDGGSVWFFDGAARTVTGPGFPWVGTGALGFSLSPAGDVQGDGVMDLVVGVPLLDGVMVISGAEIAGIGPDWTEWALWYDNSHPNPMYGYSVLGNFDLNGDGGLDFAVSAPLANATGGVGNGVIRFYQVTPFFAYIGETWGANGQGIGRSMASGADFDGDGSMDLAVGAVGSTAPNTAGSALVLSPRLAWLQAGDPVIHSWPGYTSPSGTPSRFGTSVAVTPDMSGDGFADVLVGAPNWALTSVTRGSVSIFSGRTGARLGLQLGTDLERLGSALLPTAQDFDADGTVDFLAAGMDADVPTPDCGVVKSISIHPALPRTYCSSQVNSQGCTPAIGSGGNPSASSGLPFEVTATNVINQKAGLLFYGFAPKASPFQGGTLCVQGPVRRTPSQWSGGSTSSADCSGTFSYDFNARIASGVDSSLAPGAEIYAQYWSRDPAGLSTTTNLTNAIFFLVAP